MWIILVILCLLPALYIFLISPRLFRRASMKGLYVDYAHRGLWNAELPENSLGAFKNAVERGYGIELDVQLSKDGRIMVFHDATLNRVCSHPGKLCDYTCEELQKIKLLGSEYTIPTFVDVLRTVNGRVPLLIELKGETSNTELCKRLAAVLDKYKGPFCVESFNPFLLRWFKKHRKGYARGQLVTKMTKKDSNQKPIVNFLLTHMLTNLLSRPDFIAVDGKIRNRPMIHICETVMRSRVFVWTVKSKEELIECHGERRRTIFERFDPKMK